MKNNENAFLKGLEFLAQEHFRSLRPQKGGFGVEHFHVKGYQDLLFHLEALINVCTLALGNPNAEDHPNIKEPRVHVQTVLEMAAQLIPFEEAALLDQMRELIWKVEGASD
ncbi:hypothetical protein [Flagellimonas nanhaiensis]|uniref:Uncharacterized protein n=1 Tax=Flagellimonas nanhaiensis TaxID=2292706 RepID=A0A371JQG4_9FLAO|nr:hypothetical protein [Allomuricauda nanhaiensis]RDY59741.1 hypothetical protein DX873_10275 [Allomuricauda nanhaiensis]